ncbi:S-layer homology domain-containing protein [Bacillus cereus group sp. TH43LC]|uniref:S-layer homology domain-containing protein n=1 Tax=Bacillus cereus group TaxID=86661 RepID=UPI0011A54C58|nr:MULTISPECIES: S-layer homology domain-containing protein [Bacillus cereus group]MBE7144543.1 S-layer homology domain-containing protein [Bacillus paranthracis]MDA1505109.1 S-layer homology domain-containing protein [Bacillus cereus group sp. TH43LC]MDA1791991.1 S-layer homology domain-containing protein [Bacillus cereus group sp. BY5-1LC]MDA1866594.1 S-layer homology domain-containing protein [Bacillus cereus group sp. BY128LC]MEC3528769.1 S-layer homology domain-containing protein [Bacillu
MAKTNSYKKVIAGTMTAAMVAGVVSPVAAAGKTFPDVPAGHWAEESINYLVDKGAIVGKPDGTYGPTESIDRASAAVIFTKILNLPVDENAQPSFKDAKNTWAAKYIAAVEKAGIVKGDGKENFYPEGKIDRASFASMLVSAYNLKDKVNGELVTTFDDLRKHWGEEKANILINLGISVGTGTKWEPNKTVTRAEAAQFIALTDKKYGKKDNAQAYVTDVKISEPAKLTLTGTGLDKLSADDVTLEGDKAVAIEASADGTSAVVTLGGKVAPNKDLSIKVKNQSFVAKFVYEVKKLAVEKLTFDDDRAGQAIVFKLNDEKGNADVEYLNLANHDVKFVANNLDGSPANIFEGGKSTSSTGKLGVGLSHGDYKVEVQVTKRGGLTVSNTGIISVKNLDTPASAIKSTVFAVDADKNGVVYGNTLTGKDFKLNSQTLVVGEKAQIHNVVATIAGEDKVVDPNSISIKSSNSGIISVVNNYITAEAAGEATLTIKVGDVTKDVKFKVTTGSRTLKSVKANPDKLQVVQNKELPVTFVTTDQYGDPFGANTAAIKEVLPKTGVVKKLDVTTTDAGSIGTKTIGVTGNEVGEGTVHFQNANGETLGSLYVNVTEGNVAFKNFELVSKVGQYGESPDSKLDLNVANTVEYQLSKYTSDRVYSDPENLEGYEVESKNPAVAEAKIVGNKVVVKGLKPGKVDIHLTKNGATAGKATLEIVQEKIAIKSVDFKPVQTENFVEKKINIGTVLELEKSNLDDIVKGINLTKETQHKVRVVKSGKDKGTLYLDTNGNAHYDIFDQKLGDVTVTASSDSVFNNFKADIYDALTTKYTDKGTLVFKVLGDKNVVTSEIGSQAVQVNVLNNPNL